MKANFKKNRRLFVGDLHGCLDELNDLLRKFDFQEDWDQLFSVGDVVGKGPDVPGTLKRLLELNALIVRGNHDQRTLDAARTLESNRSNKERELLEQLGFKSRTWIDYMNSWPIYRELADIIVVHAGLIPGYKKLPEMPERLLMLIRTWDGKGLDLNNPDHLPWYEQVHFEKTIVFGHWAQKGRIDLPKIKGLDTGCVYGNALTGWCPEEDRFIQVPARKAYAAIHLH